MSARWIFQKARPETVVGEWSTLAVMASLLPAGVHEFTTGSAFGRMLARHVDYPAASLGVLEVAVGVVSALLLLRDRKLLGGRLTAFWSLLAVATAAAALDWLVIAVPAMAAGAVLVALRAAEAKQTLAARARRPAGEILTFYALDSEDAEVTPGARLFACRYLTGKDDWIADHAPYLTVLPKADIEAQANRLLAMPLLASYKQELRLLLAQVRRTDRPIIGYQIEKSTGAGSGTA